MVIKFCIFDRHGGLRDTDVEAWSALENHSSGFRALGCRCLGSKTDTKFVRCPEGIGYEGWLVDLMKLMCEQSQFDDRPAIRYYVVGWPFDFVWFMGDHDYWAGDCYLEMS